MSNRRQFLESLSALLAGTTLFSGLLPTEKPKELPKWHLGTNGNSYSGTLYISTDGSTWEEVGRIDLPPTLQDDHTVTVEPEVLPSGDIIFAQREGARRLERYGSRLR